MSADLAFFIYKNINIYKANAAGQAFIPYDELMIDIMEGL